MGIMNAKKKIFCMLLTVAVISTFIYGLSITVEAATNPLITYSPDGTGFTFGFGDKTGEQFSSANIGMTVNVLGVRGIEMKIGYHEYKGVYKGDVPVAYWKLVHTPGRCVHSQSIFNVRACSLDKLGANTTNCGRVYNSGWNAYCARCGQVITPMIMYITRDMAGKIYEIPSATECSSYFYLCPYDRSMETCASITHTCSLLSANKYKVSYYSGATDTIGNMPTDTFYYNNESEYNGNAVTAASRLSENIYQRPGYVFVGWSSEAGGEVLFDDCAEWTEVQGLLEVGRLGDGAAVKLYAVWEREGLGPGISKKEKLEVEGEIVRPLKSIDGKDVFEIGECGELRVKTSGYAERVEIIFPEKMSEYNASFDYAYDDSNIKTETVHFIVKDYDVKELSSYVVLVKAYRGGEEVECYPIIYLDANARKITDELRTSLR